MRASYSLLLSSLIMKSGKEEEGRVGRRGKGRKEGKEGNGRERGENVGFEESRRGKGRRERISDP